MHSIHTLVLRLLYDSQNPELLRGSLQAVGEKEAHPFVGEEDLCALAARLIQYQAGPEGMEPVEQSRPAEGQDDPRNDQNLETDPISLKQAGKSDLEARSPG